MLEHVGERDVRHRRIDDGHHALVTLASRQLVEPRVVDRMRPRRPPSPPVPSARAAAHRAAGVRRRPARIGFGALAQAGGDGVETDEEAGVGHRGTIPNVLVYRPRRLSRAMPLEFDPPADRADAARLPRPVPILNPVGSCAGLPGDDARPRVRGARDLARTRGDQRVPARAGVGLRSAATSSISSACRSRDPGGRRHPGLLGAPGSAAHRGTTRPEMQVTAQSASSSRPARSIR